MKEMAKYNNVLVLVAATSWPTSANYVPAVTYSTLVQDPR